MKRILFVLALVIIQLFYFVVLQLFVSGGIPASDISVSSPSGLVTGSVGLSAGSRFTGTLIALNLFVIAFVVLYVIRRK
ncbi:MAG: hypothetical protein AB1467_07025 [Candidatus Diapherotrites archaeon]